MKYLSARADNPSCFYLNYEELKHLRDQLLERKVTRFYLNYEELKPQILYEIYKRHRRFYLNYEELI